MVFFSIGKGSLNRAKLGPELNNIRVPLNRAKLGLHVIINPPSIVLKPVPVLIF